MRNATILQPESATPLYLQVAGRIEDQIEGGTFRVGDRLPSVRSVSRDWGISISTVLEAYRRLESRGVIEIRPQSGHYVLPRTESLLPEPAPTDPPCVPQKVSALELTQLLVKDAQTEDLPRLGLAVPNPEHLPVTKLNRIVASVSRRLKGKTYGYELGQGAPQLRKEIARRLGRLGCTLKPDDLQITNGATEAVSLAIDAILKPGDTVVVESPCYCAFFRHFERIGVNVLEIPTHPRTGISLEALEFALIEHDSIAACFLVPNFNNPLGSLMPDENKKRLLAMLRPRQIPIIEDDVYGDLSFSDDRPAPLKAFDEDGAVIYCSSVSKSLAPGLRVGWVAGGRYKADIAAMKTQTTYASETLSQYTVAEFLENGGYETHLRRLRRILAQQTDGVLHAVAKYFPENTRTTRPEGGFVVWVELPGNVDCVDLYRRAREQRITFAPGVLFTTGDRYRNFIRLNTSYAGRNAYDAIEKLGDLVKKLAS